MPCVWWNVQRNFHRHLNSDESQILTLCYVWVYDITHASWHPFYHRNWFVPIFSFFSMSLSYMLTCAYLSIVCMHTYFAFLVSLFIHIIHSFPNWYLFLFFLIPLSFMIKNGRNFWTLVHMHRRRYIDKGRLT